MSSPSKPELWFLSVLTTQVLVDAVRGNLDLNQLARDEMIRRGLDPEGEWVGSRRARELHNPNH